MQTKLSTNVAEFQNKARKFLNTFFFLIFCLPRKRFFVNLILSIIILDLWSYVISVIEIIFIVRY